MYASALPHNVHTDILYKWPIAVKKGVLSVYATYRLAAFILENR